MSCSARRGLSSDYTVPVPRPPSLLKRAKTLAAHILNAFKLEEKSIMFPEVRTNSLCFVANTGKSDLIYQTAPPMRVFTDTTSEDTGQSIQFLFADHDRKLASECPHMHLDSSPSIVKYISNGVEAFIHISPPQQNVLDPLLPFLPVQVSQKPCLVVDLDETLVHSVTTPLPGNNPDFTLEFEIEGIPKEFFIYIRPYIQEFLEFIGEHYECVLFTASVEFYANVVMDKIDPARVFQHRLFRSSCSLSSLGFVKDLDRLGRDVTKTLIIDNTPICYMLHPNNGISVNSWLGGREDKELLELIDLLTFLGFDDPVLAFNNYRRFVTVKDP